MEHSKKNRIRILLARLEETGAHSSGQRSGRISDQGPRPSLRPESALGRLLTAKALQLFLGREPSAAELEGEVHTGNEKPFFPAFPDFHYNVSHSGEYVVCAFSDRPVGVDLQQIPGKLEHTLPISRRFFSREEDRALKELLDASDPSGHRTLLLFTRFWTAREAYIKLTGRGLAEPFENFRPDLENRKILVRSGESAFLSECDAPAGYCMSVCSFRPIESCELIRS